MKYLTKGMMPDFEDLLGHTFNNIVKFEDNEIHFVADNFTVRMYHAQDCCEYVYISDICGDLSDLIDSPITMAREDSGEIPDACESGTWTFYNIGTSKGSVNIRWNGESNGYYSEAVDLEII